MTRNLAANHAANLGGFATPETTPVPLDVDVRSRCRCRSEMEKQTRVHIFPKRAFENGNGAGRAHARESA